MHRHMFCNEFSLRCLALFSCFFFVRFVFGYLAMVIAIADVGAICVVLVIVVIIIAIVVVVKCISNLS